MEIILETTNLTKQFGKSKAVNKVDLHVKQGDIYGLIGKNGAGKTTILRMIAGLSEPTDGNIFFFGKDGRDRKLLMSRTGNLIENPGLCLDMTAYENMKMKSLSTGQRKDDEIEELLDLVGLKDTGKKTARKFSLGMRQRLGIALALIDSPDLVILDEPINGLDPQGIADIREAIVKLNQTKKITFIISSHILEELSKLATAYGIIDQGNLVEELTAEELYEKCSKRMELMVSDMEKTCMILEKRGIKKYTVVDAKTVYIYEQTDSITEIVLALAELKITISYLSVKNDSLEEYYLKQIGGNHNA